MKQYIEKIGFYKKIAKCFKEIQNHNQALYYYKKQLQLSWEQQESMHELEAYDLIGIQYYYLGNIDKAIYYHNRMMNGELEINSTAKAWSIEQVQKTRLGKEFQLSRECKTMFQFYKEARELAIEYNFPHENKKEIAKTDMKIQDRKMLSNIISPKFKSNNVKENLLDEALNKLLMKEGLNTSINIETSINIPDISLDRSKDQTKTAFTNDNRVVNLANK